MIVGIAGHQRLENPEDFKKHLKTLFAWIQDKNKTLEISGESQAGLGLPLNQITLLCDLTPGAGTVAAEEARETGIAVQVALPFPSDLYRQSSAFKTLEEENKLDVLSGDIPKERQFVVWLNGDRKRGKTDRENARQSDLKDTIREARRFQAVGEYIAVYSHLLLLAGDPDENATEGYAPIAIERSKQEGTTSDLLAVRNRISWADNGPVIRVPTEPSGTWSVRHPLDLRPGDDYKDETRWHRAGWNTFRAQVARFRFFQEKPTAERVDELKKMLGDWEGKAKIHLEKSRELTALRGVADASAREKKASQQMMLILLFSMIIAGLCLHVYSHWHPKDTSHLSYQLIKGISLLLALGVPLWALARFHHFAKSGRIGLGHELRSLAEALRVQIYWNCAGLGRSVAANYLQRQRNELDWIRSAVSSVSFPYEAHRESFEELKPEKQDEIRKMIKEKWFQEQRSYHSIQAYRMLLKLRLCHMFGFGLAIAAVLHMGLLLGAELSKGFKLHLKTEWPWWVLGCLVLAGIFRVIPRKGHPLPRIPSGKSSQGKFILTRGTLRFFGAERWLHLPLAFAVAALALSLSFAWQHVTWMTDLKSLWLIVVGSLLLGSALIIAWCEKSMYAETYQQSAMMAQLFRSVNERAEVLFGQLNGTNNLGEKDAIRRRLDLLYYEMGQESLDENAEWLLLRRARPLEPFVPG